MPSTTIQWFPGHMAKTRRLIQENLPQIDVLIEVLDARIPLSSRNPEIHALAERRPILSLLNKSSLSSPEENANWLAYFKRQNEYALLTDCATGEGISSISAAIKDILSDKIERYRQKGMEGRRLRAMIVGIPNVGKSSLINRLCGAGKTKVENRPGVTTSKQWVSTSMGIDLLDMPGVLWPKFEDRTVGENLAFTGAIKDNILDSEELASLLATRLSCVAPVLLCQRYKLKEEELLDKSGYNLLTLIGERRGMKISGGEVDTLRASNMLIDEFRHTKIGRITLEKAPKQEI